MLKNIIRTLSLSTMILILAPACAEQDKGASAPESNKPVTETTAPAAESAPVAAAADGAMAIMDMPVNFSTPEEVEKSIEAVRQQAGDAAARNLNNAMKYIMYYDLSVGHDKEKMYKKLDGRTPNEIIAKMKR